MSSSGIRCWFCLSQTEEVCRCGRGYCRHHEFAEGCVICALGFGHFERDNTPEPLSTFLVHSFSVASGDPYIVIPPTLRGTPPMPLDRAEALVGTLVQMLTSADIEVSRRAAGALAAATNSWPTLDPSRLSSTAHGTGLLALDEVRKGLMAVLNRSRALHGESLAVAVLDKLRTADFRDLYPAIVEGLATFKCAHAGTRVAEVFQAMIEFYPSSSYAANERVELLVYEQYMNRQRGAGQTMERIWGQNLRYEPRLVRMFKKGVWHTNSARFLEWYPGEDEPH